jgi:lipid II:glycine glycyltransferase (peptidoglycan interpeptide bridge formation enzyme)
MDLGETSPDAWDDRISSPIMSQGFAEAARGLGFRPFFAEDRHDRALILLRTVPLPVVRRLTLRAKAYVDRGDPDFLGELLGRLQRLGVAHVRLNDERHGLADTAAWSWPRVQPLRRYVFLIDTLDRTDDDFRAAMADPVPRNIRKAQRAQVEVHEIATDADLEAFHALMDQTSDRMRSRHVAAVYPRDFFRRAFHAMVPRGQALFLLARADGEPLAGQMYLLSRERMTYYHGASTRERRLTPKHGPTAAFWHALRLARDRKLTVFDFGGANPTSDPQDVHFSVTDFKRRWGGRHVMVPGADVVLSPMKVAFQDHCLKPFWDRVHPLYLRMFQAA